MCRDAATGLLWMAGAFGCQTEHYDVSMRCAERALLPAVVRGVGKTPVADGFACREQIRQGTGQPCLHVAELLDNALSGNRQPDRSKEQQ